MWFNILFWGLWEMTSKYFIPMKSAHSQSMKRSILSNDGLRRFLNMSPDLPLEEFLNVMNQYAVKMWQSGYPASRQADAIQSAFGQYEKILNGQRDNRRLEKLRKYKLWHKEGMNENIVAGAPLIIFPLAGDQISKKMKI